MKKNVSVANGCYATIGQSAFEGRDVATTKLLHESHVSPSPLVEELNPGCC